VGNKSIAIHFPLSTIHYAMTPPKMCGDCGTQMEVNQELYAIPSINETPTGLQFNFSRALPVTAYVCPNCGRFKLMSAVFLKNVEITQPQAVQSQAATNNDQNLTGNESGAVA
jgi:hypothetical protein